MQLLLFFPNKGRNYHSTNQVVEIENFLIVWKKTWRSVVSLTISLMRFNTYDMVPTLQRCLSILMFCFTPSGVQDHVNIETVDLDYWDGSSTWLAVVSTLSSFESLISPSHWLKKNSASNIPKKFHQPRKLKMKFKIWEQSMQGDQNSNTQRVNIPPSQNLELQPQKHSILLSDYPRIQTVTH